MLVRIRDIVIGFYISFKRDIIETKLDFFKLFQAYFNAPDGDEPLALDMSSMGKGQIWVNGQSLGRYWTVYASGNCSDCSYTGIFKPSVKCQLGCGQPTQRW